MSPSSPVSVGMTPSNRTLEVGSVQVDVAPSLVTFEHCPSADDPNADSDVGKVKSSGVTGEEWRSMCHELCSKGHSNGRG